MLKTRAAEELGAAIAMELRRAETAQAYALISPILMQKISFAMLDKIGRQIGQESFGALDPFLDKVAASETIGSWALLGAILAQHLDADLAGALERERTYAMRGDVWYAADALGERVAGPALVKHFDPTLDLFEHWRTDPNRWVRRSIGVGTHVWAKRARGTASEQATRLLDFFEPLWGEQEMDAVKGIGWGLKTIGRYYPALMRAWLKKQQGRPHRATMLRKAQTYLNVRK